MCKFFVTWQGLHNGLCGMPFPKRCRLNVYPWPLLERTTKQISEFGLAGNQVNDARELTVIKHSKSAPPQWPNSASSPDSRLRSVRPTHPTFHRPAPSSPSQATPRAPHLLFRRTRQFPRIETHQFLLEI